MRKCKNGWHLDDGRGWHGTCSYCILKLNHPTLRRFNELLLRNQRRGLVREGLLSDMRQETERLPMRPRQVIEARLRADYKQAAALLKDDLVWSGDFDTIRFDLLELINDYVDKTIYAPVGLTNIVQKLIAEENDLSI